MAERCCERWLITGRVQGVGYRAWMVDQATGQGLDGWVRNLDSGSVEALILGDAGTLAQLHDACLRGPTGAHVAGITRSTADPGPLTPGSGFRQARDGA